MNTNPTFSDKMPSKNEIKSEDKTDARVLVAPSTALENISTDAVRIVKLRHPRTSQGACFLFNSSNNSVYEMMNYEEEHRSWFLGEKVVSDGRMILVTPVNPVFLILPYIIKAERLVPLDQMVTDEEFTETDDVLVNSVSEAGLEKVGDRKGSKDLNVWKYNRNKTLEWLERKVRSLGDHFKQCSFDTTGGASSSIYKTSAADEHEYLRYALGVVQEYLDPALGDDLETKLDLPKVEVKTGNKRLSSVDVDDEENKPRKKVKTESGPIEDYSKNAKKAAVKEEVSAKQKALAQSAKGTKSIMSFFGKK